MHFITLIAATFVAISCLLYALYLIHLDKKEMKKYRESVKLIREQQLLELEIFKKNHPVKAELITLLFRK